MEKNLFFLSLFINDDTNEIKSITTFLLVIQLKTNWSNNKISIIEEIYVIHKYIFLDRHFVLYHNKDK